MYDKNNIFSLRVWFDICNFKNPVILLYQQNIVINFIAFTNKTNWRLF